MSYETVKITRADSEYQDIIIHVCAMVFLEEALFKRSVLFFFLQAELYARLDDIPRKIRQVPFKKIAVIALPFLCYFLLYFNYSLFRTIIGLGKVTRPNYTFLPWLEVLIFHCYPHQILAGFAHPLLDIVAAVPYLVHFPLPALFAIYKVATTRRIHGLFPFVWCAGWVNLLSTIIQFLFPTAPPWFVDSVVFSPDGSILKFAANEAGFHRLDAILGVPFFHSLYSASPLKYGAMPSLHVAWPAIVLVSGPWISERFAMFHIAWITWAALYSNHHYGVDAIAGIFLVFLVNFMMRKVWSPFPMENGKKPCCSLCQQLCKGRAPPLLEV